MEPFTIARLKEESGEQPLTAAVDCQLQGKSERLTRTGKPYLELSFADATGSFSLKAWSDAPLFEAAADWAAGTILRLQAEWTQNQYGLNSNHLDFRALNATERANFLAGDPQTREKQDGDWMAIGQMLATLSDPRLKAISERFLAQYGERFRRTAAARKNHHARRGGLVEHVAQMMRSTVAISSVYPQLNRDLMLVGVLLHDCGKMWENSYPEDGFTQPYSLHGELLGHIPLGIELTNKLWRDLCDEPSAREWLSLEPANEEVRLHLLHLIASHHGQYEFGSPTLPRTPEAIALHYIDNLDAKLEMMKDAYAQAGELGEGIYERVFPLPSNLVRPLPRFAEAPMDFVADEEVSFSEPTLPPSVVVPSSRGEQPNLF